MKTKIVRRPLAVAMAAIFSWGVQADDVGVFFSELPVVATVSRLQQPLADAPGSVTVIDRDMIKASGVRDINDLFRLVPGFNTFPMNNDTAPKVTYHGLTDEEFSPRVQVLIDGRSMYSPLFRGGVNWATIPVALEDIERVEVLRGSNSAAYGSNAFLGVINIITVDPSQVRGVSVSTNYGNQGVRDYTLRTGGKIGEMGNFRFTYQQRDDNGLTDQYDWKDGFRSRLVDLRANLALSGRDELQINAGHVEGTTLTGRYLTANDQLVQPMQQDPCSPFTDIMQANTFLQLAWRRALAADEDLQVRYAHVEDWASSNHVERCTNTRIKPPYPGIKASTNDLLYRVDLYGNKGTRDELEVQHTVSPWRNTRLVWGGGGRWETTRSATMFHGDPGIRRQVLRGFGNFEWKPASWLTLNAGATAENDSLAGFTLSPRLSANFHLDPENTVRLGASRSHRTLSAIDLRGERWKSPYSTASGVPIQEDTLYVRRFYGDPKQAPERIDSLEIGYLGDWKAQRMSLDVRLFHETIPNRIVELGRNLTDPALCQVSSGPPFDCTAASANYSTSAQNVRIEGIEYQWRWQPFDSTRLLLNQAFLNIHSRYLQNLFTTASTDTLNNLYLHTKESSPRHSTTVMLMQKLPYGLEFSATHYWVGDMKWTRNTRAEPFRRLDLRLGYPFRWGSTSGEVAYTLQNANGEHGEFKYDPYNTANPTAVYAGRVVSERQWLTLRIDLQ